jgi:hypothetical protein
MSHCRGSRPCSANGPPRTRAQVQDADHRRGSAKLAMNDPKFASFAWYAPDLCDLSGAAVNHVGAGWVMDGPRTLSAVLLPGPPALQANGISPADALQMQAGSGAGASSGCDPLGPAAALRRAWTIGRNIALAEIIPGAKILPCHGGRGMLTASGIPHHLGWHNLSRLKVVYSASWRAARPINGSSS